MFIVLLISKIKFFSIRVILGLENNSYHPTKQQFYIDVGLFSRKI